MQRSRKRTARLRREQGGRKTDITAVHAMRNKGVLYDITRVNTFEGDKED